MSMWTDGWQLASISLSLCRCWARSSLHRMRVSWRLERSNNKPWKKVCGPPWLLLLFLVLTPSYIVQFLHFQIVTSQLYTCTMKVSKRGVIFPFLYFLPRKMNTLLMYFSVSRESKKYLKKNFSSHVCFYNQSVVLVLLLQVYFISYDIYLAIL